jgi:hypothetical protein
MEVDGIERKLLKELSERLVMNKEEIVKFVEAKVEGSAVAPEAVVRTLVEKGYVTNSTPMGSSCFAVTTKGIKAVKE